MADGGPEEKQRAYFERTKKGAPLWLADQGGSAEDARDARLQRQQVPRR